MKRRVPEGYKLRPKHLHQGRKLRSKHSHHRGNVFQEIIGALDELEQPQTTSVPFAVDRRGFIDRQCPAPSCQQEFKILERHWYEKVSDDQVFCPFCRHETDVDVWHTREQLRHVEEAAYADKHRYVDKVIGQAVKRAKPMRFGPFKLTSQYHSGDVPAVTPAMASPLLQEFTCDACGCQYASCGASFFCPACGHDAVLSNFPNTLETVRQGVRALPDIRQTLQQQMGADFAADWSRTNLESLPGRLVGAFEQFSKALFATHPNASQVSLDQNVFQRVSDSSKRWRELTGRGFDDFLSAAELQRLILFFEQRHKYTHTDGRVDRKYLAKSKDTNYQEGQRLVIQPDEVLEMVDLLEKLSKGLRTVVP